MTAPGGITRARGWVGRHAFVRDLLTLMSGTSLGQVILLATMLVVSRVVSPEAWGIYSVITLVGGFLYPLAALRYDMAIVLPRDEDDGYALLRLATRLNVATSLAFSVLLLVFGGALAHWLGKGSNRWWLLAAAPIGWSYAQVYIRTSWANRRRRFDASARAQVFNSVATALLRLGAAFAALGPLALVAATVAGEFVALETFRRRDPLVARPVAPGRLRELAIEYRRMPLQAVPQTAIDQVRLTGITLMLTHYFGYTTTGPYSMAWGLVQTPISFVAAALSQVFFQRLAVVRPGGMSRLVRATILRMLLLGIVPFAMLYLLAPWLLPAIMGYKWVATGRMTAILVPWLWLNFVTSPISGLFVVARQQAVSLVHSTIYAAAPLLIIWRWHGSLTWTLQAVSLTMAGLLVVNILLGLWASARFDRAPDVAVAG